MIVAGDESIRLRQRDENTLMPASPRPSACCEPRELHTLWDEITSSDGLASGAEAMQGH